MDLNKGSKRITFLAGSMGSGGAERVISILANTYAENGWKVDILLLLNNQCDYKLNNSIRLISICNENKSRITFLPKWIYNIRKYVIDNNPDKIVSFIARINIITLLSCIGLNKSILISERSNPKRDGRSFFIKAATYILYPFAERIIFQTKMAQECFPAKIKTKSVIIPNPVSVSDFASTARAKKIVAVGRLRPEKNHEMLINAFSKVKTEHPDYTLFIYGEGPLRYVLKNQIKKLKLSGSIFLPGSAIDIHKKISNAEIFVLPSNHEGLSNALIEAMMMGLPCISTNYEGASEIIKDGFNGILVDVGDEDQLYKAISMLINNKEMAMDIGRKGQKSVGLMKLENIIPVWRNIIES